MEWAAKQVILCLDDVKEMTCHLFYLFVSKVLALFFSVLLVSNCKVNISFCAEFCMLSFCPYGLSPKTIFVFLEYDMIVTFMN